MRQQESIPTKHQPQRIRNDNKFTKQIAKASQQEMNRGAHRDLLAKSVHSRHQPQRIRDDNKFSKQIALIGRQSMNRGAGDLLAGERPFSTPAPKNS